jgi:hypothetical protein
MDIRGGNMRTKRFFLVLLVLFLLVGGTGVVFAQDEEPVEEPEVDGAGQNPVVVFMADRLGMTYQEILDLKEEGLGLGNISKAQYLVSLTGEGDIHTILLQASEMGWGELYKSLGLHPGGGHGLGWMFKEYGNKDKPDHGKPEWAGGPPDHAKNKEKNDD